MCLKIPCEHSTVDKAGFDQVRDRFVLPLKAGVPCGVYKRPGKGGIKHNPDQKNLLILSVPALTDCRTIVFLVTHKACG